MIVNKTLKWLHISDIHFQPKTEWRDSASRKALITYLDDIYKRNNTLRPDFIFCTGDIAFGETGSSPLANQYEQAKAFFDSLLAICGQNGTPLSKKRLFVVPGNHDVNRNSINSDAQNTLTNWAKDSSASEHIDAINQRFENRSREFLENVRRLDEYGRFIRDYLPHQHDTQGRHHYARIVSVNGLKIGIAGFNSAWTCAGPEDDRTIWLAAQWQFNSAKSKLENADIRIGLIHHPIDWLNLADRDIAMRRIASDFHFWLHGHSHNAWVIPTQSHLTITAGAVGAEAPEEFGVNLVHLDLDKVKGEVHLHAYAPRDAGWVIDPVAKHAPSGQWLFDLPAGISSLAPATASVSPSNLQNASRRGPTANATPIPVKREPVLFGRDALIKDALAKLHRQPFLLVYGLRGNGKSALIEELGKAPPLVSKELARVFVIPSITTSDLFRQFATLLGETAEFPNVPSGTIQEIAEEMQRRYPNPRSAWVWIDRAHILLNNRGFRQPEIRNLLLGLQAAFGMKWHWVFELRERPPQGLLGSSAGECFVPGLDKSSLAECLAQAAPAGQEAEWRYSGNDLKAIYQWLGGGQGEQAHPLAIQLLIEVARGRNETPHEVLKRHRGDLEKKLEERLIGDLYQNVLSASEQRMIQALALYRTAIPHDHIDILEQRLSIPGAWDGLDLRCLLSPSADHSLYYLHNFIAGWLRTRMGYAGHGEDDEADFTETTDDKTKQHASKLHSAIATCWLHQLGGSLRVTNLNISRALEAFHHLVAAGEADRIQSIAVKLLSGNMVWARQRIWSLYERLYKSKAPVRDQRHALEYAAILSRDDHKIQRFLGECWAKEEGRGSGKALKCFEEACRLRRDFPPYWANLGRTLLAQGKEGARAFIQRLEELEEDCPEGINDHVRAIQSECLQLIGLVEQAAAMRMEKISTGSRDVIFYNDEAKARLDAGDTQGALDILDLAAQNGCAGDFTEAIRANVLQQSGQAKQASALRMEKIRAGSRNAAFYANEAKARLDEGDTQGALDILDLAARNGCADDFIEAIRANVLQQSGQAKQASALRMEKIRAGSRNSVFYNDEAKARLDAGDTQGALEILNWAVKNGCADDFTEAIRANTLQQSGQAKQAAALRMEKIRTGSRNAVFYNDEAKARLDTGDTQGALEILDLAARNGCADDFTEAIRASVLRKLKTD